MDSEAKVERDDGVCATPPESEEGGNAREGMEPDLTALAQALTWEGYGELDVEGRRKMIGQLWRLQDRRKAGHPGCQSYPAGE